MVKAAKLVLKLRRFTFGIDDLKRMRASRDLMDDDAKPHILLANGEGDPHFYEGFEKSLTSSVITALHMKTPRIVRCAYFPNRQS